MDVKTILTLFCLLSAITTYGLGIFVYAKNSSSLVNRLFLAIMLGASYWAVGEFLIWQAGDYSGTLFWLKASSFWTVVIVMTVHFILTYTGHPLSGRRNRWILVFLLYIPAVIFALVEIFTDYIFIIRYQPEAGYYYVPVTTNLVYLTETMYFFILMSWGVFLGIKTWHYSVKEKIKKHSFFVSVGFLLVLGLGSQSVVILPVYGIYAPNLVFLGIVSFSLIITYAILRYDLFILSPETAAANIIRTMPDGLMLTDNDGRIITVNESAAGLLQTTRKELIGEWVGRYLPDYIYPEIEQQIEEHEAISDLEAILDDSSQTVVSIGGSLVRDPDGFPAGMILILRDITLRKASEKALSIANEKISLLSRLTRHDISNLVTPLHGYLSILKEDGITTPDDPHLQVCLDLVEKIAHHLKFSHEYHEIGMQNPEWQSLEYLIDRAVEILAEIPVEITIAVDRVKIFADPLVTKVIFNLLENAIRHGGTITHIWISTEIRCDGELVLSIRDDGTGVRDDEKELIFMHGYGKNSGLGLTLSREILSITGISIVETGIFGEGACFEIYLPRSVWQPSP